MQVNRSISAVLLSLAITASFDIRAADLVQPEAIPAPPQAAAVILQPAVSSASPERMQEEKGIWGAIAYSPLDDRHGFFWGADKSAEAVENALKHYWNADGADWQAAIIFCNHRHWKDDDGTGFPYKLARYRRQGLCRPPFRSWTLGTTHIPRKSCRQRQVA